MSVERAHVQPVAENSKAAIHRAATHRRRKVRRQSAAIIPERNARATVNRPCLIVVSRYVKNSVDDQRRVFDPAAEHSGDIGLKYPLRHKPRDILRRQLLERTVPLACVIAGKRQPSRGILKTLKQVLVGGSWAATLAAVRKTAGAPSAKIKTVMQTMRRISIGLARPFAAEF